MISISDYLTRSLFKLKHPVMVVIILVIGIIPAKAQKGISGYGISVFPNYAKTINLNTDFQNQWKFSYSANFLLAYSLSDKSNVLVGVGYKKDGEKSPTIDIGNNSSVYFISNRHHIELQTHYKRAFSDRFYGISGWSTIFNISNKIKLIEHHKNGSIVEKVASDESEYRKTNFTINLGVGYNFIQNDKIDGFIQPYMQYGVLGAYSGKNDHLFRLKVSR